MTLRNFNITWWKKSTYNGRLYFYYVYKRVKHNKIELKLANTVVVKKISEVVNSLAQEHRSREDQ